MPRNRGELYRKCFEVLIAGKRIEGRSTGFDATVGEQLLGPIAWEMQASSDDPRSVKEWSRAALLEALGRARDIDGSVRDLSPEELLRRLEQECALLVTADQQSWSFSHLTFQEYLAFRFGRGQAGKLADQAADPRWREVILLGMSDPDFQATFFGALLAQEGALPALPPDLLQAMLLEKGSAADLVARPWAEHLQGAAQRCTALAPPEPWWSWLARPFGWRPSPPPAGPPVPDLLAALEIFRHHAPRDVLAAADALCAHPDLRVQEAAARVGGREGSAQVSPSTAEPLAGQRRSLELPSGPQLALVWIPGGTFWMGASTTGEHNVDPEAKDHEGPVHQLTLGGFWMGQHPISNAQYRCFVRATGRAEPQCWRQEGYEGDEQPVTTVGLADARDFCRWLSQETGEVLRLPTEAQWEYAARGKAGRRYPWGEELPTFERAVFGWQRLASNGGRPLGATPEGVHDLAGQIWEWTCSPWGAYPTAHDRDLSTHDRFVDTSSGAATRVVRGGSWDDSAGRLRAAYRRRWRSGDRDVSLGFRVVLLREPAG